MSASIRPILAAEDEESDRLIMNLAVGRARLPHPLVTVRDGRECVDYLTSSEVFSAPALHPLPALLLLDLKMPRMHGFEVLEWLATRPELKALPVVVLSSSSAESDIQKARQLGAREYFVKPHSLKELVKIFEHIHERWLSTISHPTAVGQKTGMLQPEN
jgi:CheY-like chemotaxis protein